VGGSDMRAHSQPRDFHFRKGETKMRRIASVLVAACVLLFALPLLAQSKPYHDGSVWEMQCIHVKGGMEDRYARYLAGDWKKEQDAMKKGGYVLSYKAIRTEAHNPTDCNVILMTEYKDLATMEANADKAEELSQELFGGMPKIEAGYTDRSSYRDIIGSRLAREIVLEPKK
jgi:hypothetical protein